MPQNQQPIFVPQNNPASRSDKGRAGPSTQGNFAGVANMPTSAQIAVQNTQPPNVIVPRSVPNSAALHKGLDRELLLRLLKSPPVTPVRVERLRPLLDSYDPSLRLFLISGFTYGFHVHYFGERRAVQSPNLRSALEAPLVVNAKLEKELSAGRIAGPFHAPPFHDFVSSPLGIVPKKSPNEFRLIHHLSYPAGSSVNDGIPAEFSSVHYASINNAIAMIKRTGAGCFLAKTDIKSAFCIIPIHPEDYSLLGMKWNDLYYFDRCLPMGCSSSCAIFERFSTALEWIAKRLFKTDGILHVLDDFLFIAKDRHSCESMLKRFLSLCDYLGVPIAQEKTHGPYTSLQFVGITLDSVTWEARLPEDKLQKCRTMIDDFLSRRKVTLREIQSLIGLLNFTCSVVLPGRAFLRRLIDLTKGIRRPYHRIRVSTSVKNDLRVWLQFLEQYNGRTFFIEESWTGTPHLEMTSDAAGSKGYGALFGKHWLHGEWPNAWKSLNITFLELFPIVIALHVWGPEMADRCIIFLTDNAALVDIINQQTSKHPLVMILIRDLVLTALKHNVLFRARHLPGILNTRADLISRFQIDQFKALSPGMDDLPTQIPTHLLPRNWSSI